MTTDKELKDILERQGIYNPRLKKQCNNVKLKDAIKSMKKLREKGMDPHLKAKKRGFKIQFY